MTDLITKLEEAGEGSRELDGDIHRTLFPSDLIMTDAGSVGPNARPARREPIGSLPAVPGEVIAECIGSPSYTTSLDAALALASRVRPGWFPAAEPRFFIDGEVVRWKATLIRPLWDQYNPVTDEWFDRIENRTASTPALALCAAILRASEEKQS